MKKTYNIKITEELERIVEVEASNYSEAKEIVIQDYKKSIIVLDADDFTHVTFKLARF